MPEILKTFYNNASKPDMNIHYAKEANSTGVVPKMVSKEVTIWHSNFFLYNKVLFRVVLGLELILADIEREAWYIHGISFGKRQLKEARKDIFKVQDHT